MPGPPPKPPGQRRRRNATVSALKLPLEGRSGKAPVLPASRTMLESTREWWKTVWSSPMSAVWLDADVPAVARLAGLVDKQARGDASASVLAEIRQLEDRYGLSPLARRRLQWEVEQAGGLSVATDSSDEGRWLRVVSS